MAGKSKKSKKFKPLKVCFSIFMLVTALIMMYIVTVIASATMESIDVDAYIVNYSGQIFYKNNSTGNFENLDDVYSKENRIWVSITEMPDHLKDAAVSIEDERFYEHGGVDLKRTLGAFVYYVVDKDSAYGGSTITQQLVKNLTGQNDRSVTRKIKEMWNSFRLERKMSKDQILELYLNTMYLSQGCNGVGAASRVYFDKDVDELTIAESAAIVGITQYPTRYDPFLNPDKNKDKQEIVLKKMYELGHITEEQYEAAKEEKLNFTKHNMNDGTRFNSYFVDQVIRDVANDLVEQKGYDYESAIKLIHTGGLKIYSTIDVNIQRKIDSIYNDPSNFSNIGAQSAMVITDPYTGEVKGMAGGVGKKEGDFVLNRATMSPRQPGSSIKPIAVYAPAMEEGIIEPMSIRVDKAVTYNGWSPHNSYSGFRGAMTIQQAIQISSNTVAVQVLDELGIDKSFNFLQNKMGISTLVSSRNTNGNVVSDRTLPSLALGGLTDGVTAYDMAAAYSTFVNDGIYITPHTYTQVVDNRGKVILQPRVRKVYAMSKETAEKMRSSLQAVVRSGTGVGAAISNISVAGKTGTTDQNKDKWFVGFTPYYVGAVWFGCDNPVSMSSISGNPALKVWHKVMSKVHESMPAKTFPGTVYVPNSVSVNVCSVSGKLATAQCIDTMGNSTSVNQSFPYGQAPSSYCEPANHSGGGIFPGDIELPEGLVPGGNEDEQIPSILDIDENEDNTELDNIESDNIESENSESETVQSVDNSDTQVQQSTDNILNEFDILD